VVVEEGALLGIVTLRDVRIPKERWDASTIAEVMTPISNIKSAYPEQPVAELLEQMEEYDINQIPVLEYGKPLGAVSRYKLLNFLDTRAKLEE
jgi:CBS domain-containing protein